MAPQFDIHITLVRENHGGQKIDRNEFRCNDLGSGLSLCLPRGHNHHIALRFSYLPSFKESLNQRKVSVNCQKPLHRVSTKLQVIYIIIIII